VKGMSSEELVKVLGYSCSEEVVHRENLALLTSRQDAGSELEAGDGVRATLARRVSEATQRSTPAGSAGGAAGEVGRQLAGELAGAVNL